MTDRTPSLQSIARAATAERPRYFDDRRMDELLSLLLELAEENCVLRDRLQSAEQIMPGLGEKIDAVELSPEQTAERLATHSEKLNALMHEVATLIEQK